MPLVVIGRGRVLFHKPKRPVRIGCRVDENEVLNNQRRDLAIYAMSGGMYRLQSSLLKGK